MVDLLIRHDHGLTPLEKQEGVEPSGYRDLDGTFHASRVLVEVQKQLYRFENAKKAGVRFTKSRSGGWTVTPPYPDGADATVRAELDAYWRSYLLGPTV